MNSVKDVIWHKWLGKPYVLKPIINVGEGQTVVFLHGIGKTNVVWKHVIEKLSAYHNYQAIVFDLLGFGSSPKPNWIDYNVDDHATAIIASIDKLKCAKPVIIVAHSMGCLIALRVARLRPDLVKHLVLYEMPLYEGLPEKRTYRLRLNVYRKFYNWVINYQPTFNEKIKDAEWLARRVIGFEVDKSTWQPFIRSLKNTILDQTASDDIKNISTPMDVIYGTLDMFVIRGHAKKTLGSIRSDIGHHNIRARHIITPKASTLIVQRIVESNTPQ